MTNIFNNAISGVSLFLDNLFVEEATATSTATNSTNLSNNNNNNVSDHCQICAGDNNPEILLICDGCEAHMHTTCLGMPAVPPGDWFCPKCRREGKMVKEHIPLSTDKVVIYERVSSAGQNEPQFGRVGLETQNSIVLQFCLQRGIIIKHTFADVGSARNLKKTGDLKRGESPFKLAEYGEMIDFCQRSKTPVVIVVYSVSRFGRNLAQVVEVLTELHDMDCYVYSVSEKISSFDSRFLELAKQSQIHSDALSQLIKDSIVRRRQQGAFIGAAPYGYESYRDAQGKRLLRVCASEAVGLDIIKNNHAGLASELMKQKNIPARTGVWSRAKVEQIKKRIANL